MSDINNTGLSKPQMKNLMKFLSDTTKIPVLGAGGGFAPIGKEGYIDGTLAPQGWLICDGSTHNIADYPDLAAYYASHHGASNYYGGDGITTFAVPVRNGMPTSGVDSPDEHIVGEYREIVDGVLKKKPVYRKVIDITLANGVISGTSLLNAERAISINGMIRQNGQYDLPMNVAYNSTYYSTIAYKITSGSQGLYVTVGGYTGLPAKVIFEYTKTTDSWQTVQEGHSADGNGIFCVKATVAGDANAHQYSTEEQIVGMWVDGKPIYEKTFTNLSTPSTANTSTDLVNVSSLNIDKFLSCDGFISNGSPVNCYIHPDWFSYIGYNANTHTISGSVGGWLNTSITRLTIQYTKTSS